MYMVGISGSGKTTIAHALGRALKSRGLERLQIIDGDVIRGKFGNIFGYTYEERMKCNQVVRIVAEYLILNGISVVLAQVAPYEEMRCKVREQFAEQYIEVYVKCSLSECAKRDVKGYYKKIKTGSMQNLNGANDVFEEPKNSQIIIDTERESVDGAVNKIIQYLERNGYIE